MALAGLELWLILRFPTRSTRGERQRTVDWDVAYGRVHLVELSGDEQTCHTLTAGSIRLYHCGQPFTAAHTRIRACILLQDNARLKCEGELPCFAELETKEKRFGLVEGGVWDAIT